LAAKGDDVPSKPFLPGCPQVSQPVVTPREVDAASGPARVLAAFIAVVGAVLLGGALLLWFHYGTAVFFEMIVSGIAACV
jgi:hypothetical protein